MTKLFVNEQNMQQEQNLPILEYRKKEFQNIESVNLDNFKYLDPKLYALFEMTLKIVLKNEDNIQQAIEKWGLAQMPISGNENNFDLDKENIKKIILKEISIGQAFYPSDIANKYNLDLKMVMDVISELKESKQITENSK